MTSTNDRSGGILIYRQELDKTDIYLESIGLFTNIN